MKTFFVLAGFAVFAFWGADDRTSYVSESYSSGSGSRNVSWVDDGRLFLADTIFGCTYPWALGYDPLADSDDGSCLEPTPGPVVTEIFMDHCDCQGDLNHDGMVNTPDLIILLTDWGVECSDVVDPIYGCMDPDACNYDDQVNEDNGTCEYESCYGCMDELACTYDPAFLFSNPDLCCYPDPDPEVGCSLCECNCDYDVLGPVFVSVPSDQFGECAEGDYGYELDDDCVAIDEIVVVETRDTLSSDECGNYVHQVTLTAFDQCGNESSTQFIITVQDTENPYLFAGEFPEDMTLNCTDSWPDVPTMMGVDGCDGTIPVFFNETIEGGACNGSYDIVRTWLMTDCSGNIQTHEQVITVIDDEVPVFTIIPDDQINQCQELPYEVSAIDNCNDVTIFESREVIYEDSCGNYEHLVTLTASDSCGNFADHQFTIIVQDTIAPEWIVDVFPQDATVNCDDVPEPEVLEAFDNCEGIIEVFFYEVFEEGLCESNNVLLRTWVASDCSGNVIEHQQVLNVVDLEAPAFVEELPQDTTAECDDVPEATALSVTDNCDASVEVVFTEEIEGGSCDQAYTIIRSWTAMDCAGNSVEHVQTIVVEDTTAPEFTEVPEDQINECEELPYESAAFDNCGDAVITESREVISEDACGNYEHLVTLTATDECGNSMDYQFTIVVQDTEAPIFNEELPMDETVECDAVPATPILTAFDDCDAEVEVIFSEELIDGGCPQSYTHIRTWTVSDCSGNTASHVQTVEVVDTTAPIFIEVPTDQVNQCEEQPYTSFAEDNCSEITITEDREVISEDECGNYEHLVTLTAADECGNTSVHQFTILVQDTEAPVFDQDELPEHLALSCADGIPTPEILTATDNCDEVTVVFTESFDATNPCNIFFTRIWTATDCSGNAVTHQQTVAVVDQTAPEFVSLPDELVTVNLDENCQADTSPDVTGWPEVMDSCSDFTIEYEDDNAVDSCPGSYSFIRTWYATDDCGNMASFTQEISAVDNSAPVLIQEPTDLVLACDGIGNLSTLDVWLQNNGGAMAVDNCSNVSWTNDYSEIISGCGSSGEAVVTFIAEDECGNITEVTAQVLISDEVAPILQSEAQDLTVECDGAGNVGDFDNWLASNGGATATDACGDVTWSNDFAGLSDGCGATGSATVTFTATDDCGNATSTTATFSIEDTIAPELEEVAMDLTVECDGAGNSGDLEAWLLANGGATATDICGGVTWSNDFAGLSDGCGATGSATVTFTATDDCGNATSATATFTIEDTIAPELEEVAMDLTVECDGAGNVGDWNAWLASNGGAIATDACGAVSWSNEFIELSDECGETGSSTVTFIAIDDCGNSNATVATFTIVDTTAPTLDATASDLTIVCDGQGNDDDLDNWLASNGGATATDACSDVTWSNDFGGLDMGCGAAGSTTVTFTATDDCGNATSTTATFMIEDTTAPELEDAVDATVECDGAGNVGDLEAWLLANGGATATDICGGVTWSNDFAGLSDECGATGSATVTFTATDDCGNTSSTTATFSIIDTIAPELEDAVDAAVECDGAGNVGELEAWLASNGGAIATDACGAVTWSNDFEGLSDECGATGSATVTFTATDDCGNATSTTATFSIEDTTAPVIEGPDDQVNQCEEVAYDYNVIDACGSVNTEETREVISFDDCGNYEHLVIITAVDDCGNTATYEFSILVLDTEAPEFIESLPMDELISCSEMPSEAAVLTASDNCDEEVDVNFVEETIAGECGNYSLIRTWTAMDCSGNTIQHVQLVEVQDITAPTVTVESCPEVEVTISLDAECEADLSPETLGMPVAFAEDDCSGAEVVIVIDDSEPVIGCGSGMTFVRTFTIFAVDGCGLESDAITCTQTISTIDDASPIFDVVPGDLVFNCEEGSYEATAFDYCSDVEIAESREVLSEDGCGNYVHLVTLVASDECGNTEEYSFTITVEDVEAPEWDQPMPESMTIGCGELTDPETYSATDNCDDLINVEYSEVVDGDPACAVGFMVYRTWTATDCSGNSIIWEQVITIEDSEAPTFDSEIPENLVVECDNVPLAELITASDNCDNDVVVVVEEEFIEGPCDSRYTLLRTWVATDDCGNSISASQTLTVVDTTAPVWSPATPPPPNIVVTCNNIPEPAVLVAIDNCDDSVFIFYQENVVDAYCNGQGNGYILRTWVGFDCMGNIIAHTQGITVLE